NIEGSRKFTESESSGTVSCDTDAIVVDVDPKPQNVINSLESEEVIADAQSTIELRKQYKKYKEAKRHKQERSGGNNPNKNYTDKEQDIKGSEELDVLVQDIAAAEVSNNTIQQTKISTDLQQDEPDDQLDPKEVIQQTQKHIESTNINMLNVDYKYVQTQAKESNMVEQ
ncbi:2829_t:CDS:2, partial [Racocetra fulgida]